LWCDLIRDEGTARKDTEFNYIGVKVYLAPGRVASRRRLACFSGHSMNSLPMILRLVSRVRDAVKAGQGKSFLLYPRGNQRANL